MGFSRQEYWSGLPFPSPGDLPDPGIEPRSPLLEADALTSEPSGKPHCILTCAVCIIILKCNIYFNPHLVGIDIHEAVATRKVKPLLQSEMLNEDQGSDLDCGLLDSCVSSLY